MCRRRSWPAGCPRRSIPIAPTRSAWRCGPYRRRSPAGDAPKVDAAPPFSQILARREAWGAGLGHFCNNYAFYFVISWLPLYLVKTRGFTVSQMAEVGGLIYLVYAASSILTGW